MIRHRALAGATVGLLAAVLGLPGAALAGPRGTDTRLCAIHPLPLPTGVALGRAQAVDPTGRFVAGIGSRVVDGVWEQVLLLWRGGRVTAVDTALAEQVVGVNASGVVVGNAFITARPQPWRYQDGRPTDLVVPGSVSGAWVTGINGRGDIVGFGAVEATENAIVLRWPADRPGAVEVVDVLPDATATAVLDDGTILGYGRESLGASSYVGWMLRPDGRLTLLTMPGRRSAYVSAARGGWAVGGAGDDGEEGFAPVRWDLRTGATTMLDPTAGSVEGVTPDGVVLGSWAVWRDGRLTPLPSADDVSSLGSEAIADNGTVVGWTNTGRLTPARWTGC
ncbi:hypothetical protein [Micromonospora sp. WMMD987]|uniref:hypothetical protein n=1 Tax=Micromonospora sp. WMMD987 TaxID=3016089 RepID=UPI002499E0E0|nr:hypothetical protein [Micromonospora sp. WMMD987]WFE93345.1 hypothetical protein O7612_18200 [Micromonospora sp. WMMD987]